MEALVEKSRHVDRQQTAAAADASGSSRDGGAVVAERSVPPPPRAVTPADPALPGALGLAKTHRRRSQPPFDCIALLLQGGGALGAYQAGVYEALAEAGIAPDWVAGISIGSINAAIIAGNPPESRVGKLRDFWEGVTRSPLGLDGDLGSLLSRGDAARAFVNQLSAAAAATAGAAGFFAPRIPNPWFQPPGTIEATSYYDTTPLRATLEALIDFDRINSERADIRLSLGAVNVRSGNLTYFDTATHTIRPEHVMASGALPPGFPAVEIEGEHYWDGGLVSNTPLQWVAANHPADTLAFQVDLWNAQGELPRSLAEVATRQKEIQYSSRTRAFTDVLKHRLQVLTSVANLLDQLPEHLKQSDDAKFLASVARRRAHNIVHLIYRPSGYEGESKDYEFSRRSMQDHWRAGYYDAVHTLRHDEVLERPTREAIATFDFARGGD
jgi:NTE family protein